MSEDQGIAEGFDRFVEELQQEVQVWYSHITWSITIQDYGAEE